MSNKPLSNDTYSNELAVYVNQEKAAVDLAHMVGKLLFDKSIELVLFRNHLADTRITEILRLHKYAAEVVGKPISVFSTPNNSSAGICVVDVTTIFFIGTEISVKDFKLSGILVFFSCNI